MSIRNIKIIENYLKNIKGLTEEVVDSNLYDNIYSKIVQVLINRRYSPANEIDIDRVILFMRNPIDNTLHIKPRSQYYNYPDALKSNYNFIELSDFFHPIIDMELFTIADYKSKLLDRFRRYNNCFEVIPELKQAERFNFLFWDLKHELIIKRNERKAFAQELRDKLYTKGFQNNEILMDLKLFIFELEALLQRCENALKAIKSRQELMNLYGRKSKPKLTNDSQMTLKEIYNALPLNKKLIKLYDFEKIWTEHKGTLRFQSDLQITTMGLILVFLRKAFGYNFKNILFNNKKNEVDKDSKDYNSVTTNNTKYINTLGEYESFNNQEQIKIYEDFIEKISTQISGTDSENPKEVVKDIYNRYLQLEK